MASVKANYNPDGKIVSYRWRACIGRDEITGKQLFATKTVPAPVGLTPAKAMKEMERQAAGWEKKVREGNAPVKDETFRHFIEKEFIPVHVRNGKHSPSTIKFYSDICSHLVERFGKKDLCKIKSIDVERYLVDLAHEKRTDKNGNEKPLSATYVKHHRTVLAVCFGFAEKHRLIESNPMRFVEAVKTDRKTVDFLTEEEARKFLTMLEDESPFWKAAMYTLIFCGLRRGELVGLEWQDVDFRNGLLNVRRNVIRNEETNGNLVKSTKTSTSHSQVPIPASALMMLKAWKTEQENNYGKLLPNAFIFSAPDDCYKPIRPDSVTQWLSRFESKHGLRKVSPHDLRHTCGSLLLQSGASVKEVQTILRHADASTTLRYYCGVDGEKLKGAADRLDSMIGNG